MLKLSSRTTKSLLALHGWLAVLLGLLLYVVVLTGTLAVFSKELGQWSNPLAAAAPSHYPEGIDGLLRGLSERIDPGYREELFVFPSADGRLRALFHSHTTNDEGATEERGVLALIDPSRLVIVEEREGEVGDLFEALDNSAFTDFLVDLHVRLVLPGQWGLLLTGVLGFAMLAAAVSGFLLHRHLITELFTLRRRGGLLTARDKHALAGAWNLPFAFLLAFTGAFFSFGGAIGLPAIAYVAFGGDVDSVSEQLLSTPLPEDTRAVPLVNLDALLADARQRTGAEPDSLQILHWGRADASVRMSMHTVEGRLLADHIAYAGATGEYLGLKPVLGNAPSVGGDLAGLMTPLHFGNFAGLYSKILWFAFGFASAYVTLTGLTLWTARRRNEPGWAWLERATVWVGFGLPLSLLVNAFVVFGCGMLGSPAVPWLLECFAATAVLSGIYVWRARDIDGAKRALLGCLAVLLMLAPLARWLDNGVSWVGALNTGQLDLMGVDIALVIAALCCLRASLAGSRPPEPEPESRAPVSMSVVQRS